MAKFQFSVSTECISRTIFDIEVVADDYESAKQKIIAANGDYNQTDMGYRDDAIFYQDELDHFQDNSRTNPYNHSRIVRHDCDIIYEEGTPTGNRIKSTISINNNKRRLL